MSGQGYLDRGRLEAALGALAEAWEVVAPVLGPGEEVPRLAALPARGTLILEARKTLLPLKTLFLPESEELFRFVGGEDGTAVTPAEPPARDRLVVGALGCDLGALDLLDRVFLEEPADEAYRGRRQRTAIVALACSGEGAECFCASTGIDPLRPSGADALLAPAGDGWILEALTRKGERVVEAVQDLLREPTAAEREAASGPGTASRGDAPLPAPPGGWHGVWESDLWEELAALCLGCGVCTVLCPTCHCFDVQDERRAGGGCRFRAWDSCMFAQFTGMAGGDNPRAGPAARLRQRFLHKLSYFPERYGAVACVGCGRCTRSCPQGIGIEEVARRLAAGGALDE